METLEDLQEAHLRSIESHGLISAMELNRNMLPYVPSSDSYPSRFIYTNPVTKSRYPSQTLRDIQLIVSLGCDSILHILAERARSSLDSVYENPLRTLQERWSNSIVVISTVRKYYVNQIPTAFFATILVPEDLKKIVSKTFPLTRVVPVEKTTLTYNHNNGPIEVEIPNYEKGIQNFLENRSVGETFYVHAVRLPTKYDNLHIK